MDRHSQPPAALFGAPDVAVFSVTGRTGQREYRRSRPRRATVTLRDVARRAGVSPALVSFVLTGGRSVGDESRRRVLAAVGELGYTPNAAARELRSQRSGLVAMLVPRLDNPLYSLYASGAEEELSGAGLLAVVSATRPAAGDASRGGTLLGALRRRHVDGVLLHPYREDVPAVMHLLAGGTPVVFLDREPELPPDAPPADAVVVDTEAGVHAAAEHLLGLGHRRIGLISLEEEAMTGPVRLEGYRRAFRERALAPPEDCVALGRSGPAEGYAMARRLLGASPRITALVVTLTLCVPGALSAVHGAGLRIPDDLSFVAFSHDALLTYPSVHLTAVRYPAVELGREAARLVVQRIQEGGPAAPRRVVLRPELQPGGTTRAVEERA